MATVLLSAAGSSFGASAGGTVLGFGAATLGKAAGAIAGGLIDQQVLGRGAQPVGTGRIDRFRVQGAGEGDPIPRLFGRMRIGGQIIWTGGFREHVDESRQGGKGGGARVRAYRYTVSIAVALCEGPIRRIGRVWADGNEISLGDYDHRIHNGGPNQAADPLIDDAEGGAPAFHGVAYIVFEDLPLSAFGNRIPQLNFEVWREPESADAEGALAMTDLVRAVALSPGSGEFSLETEKVRRIVGPGRTTFENVNTLAEEPDLVLALDQLEAEAPNCGAVSLIVSWFGDDLRCASCSIRPAVETADKETAPTQWRVSGVGRGGAPVVSPDADGRPQFGGTPADGSVIRAIRELKARGLKVMFYPFILMDVPGGNQKPDPWSGATGQPAFPWRGRITLDRAAGVAGSADKTAAAAAEIDAFFGAASVGDFAPGGETVAYSGPAEWSFRRFILHYANLCALAGGVESFCIGSEMRGLTQIRSGATAYPAVDRLKTLARDVRSVVGAETKLGYAADWSEYFGHQPGDGSGDVLFHLDPLWSDAAIDFVGIDNYLPLSDWRYVEGHADEAAGSVYALDYLDANVEGGEGYDWFYADAAARVAQNRAPIADTAHGEDWIFRPKDIRNWWERPHHNRPGGVREAAPTAWSPRSKPIWFTEIGCPAVDLGANQPNVFVDPKSSESALPYFSRGVRDDFMQRRYLEAALAHWRDPARNPVSAVYGGRMIDTERAFVWTWDARPWPDFPNRSSVWSDGANHRLGHWISGRLGAAPLADVVAEICRQAGLRAFDVSELHGVVQGCLVDEGQTGRAALQPFMMAYAFDAVESGGVIRFRHRDRPRDAVIEQELIVASREGGAEISLTRAPEGDLPRAIRFGFIDSERNYETGALEARVEDGLATRVEASNAPLLFDAGAAQTIAERHLAEARAGREGCAIAAARRLARMEPGDIVSVSGDAADGRYRIDAIEDRGARALTLTRIEPQAYAAVPAPVRGTELAPVHPASPLVHAFMDLPLTDGAETGPQIAAFSAPWTGAASLFVSDGDAFGEVARIRRPAAMGVLAEPLRHGAPGRWTRGGGMVVRLFGGGLEATSRLSVLNGANRAALMSPAGEWEIVQFQTAELIGENLWRLTRLLRGQAGTEPFIGAPTPEGAAFVLLDGAVADIASPAAFRGVPRDWRIGPSRKPHGHDSYVGFTAADEAARLRPYAPAHLRAARDPQSGDVALSWIRRTRVNGDSWVGPEPPLGEEREAYSVRVGASAPTETGAPRWVWTQAAQIEAGASGAVDIAVSQISDQFGPGPESKVTINV